jgi:hypothetical protein
MSLPQPIPYIGPHFKESKKRLLFVGIETYGNQIRKNRDQILYDRFLTEEDVDDTKNESEHNPFWNWVINDPTPRRSPFWHWVINISEQLISPGQAEKAFNYIAYSNLVKCQARERPSSQDEKYEDVMKKSSYQITEKLYRNCIQKAGWIYREIRTIEAKNIIIFAGRKQNHFLARLFLNDEEGIIISKTDYEHNYIMRLTDGVRNFVISYHPQGAPKSLRDEIIRTIEKDDWNKAIQWKMP